MAKFYSIRSDDGHRSYGCVTKRTAKGMVHRGEAFYVGNCSAIQLYPPQASDKNLENKSIYRQHYKLRGGLSLFPNHHLTLRYVAAKNSDSDSEAVDAVEGWAR